MNFFSRKTITPEEAIIKLEMIVAGTLKPNSGLCVIAEFVFTEIGALENAIRSWNGFSGKLNYPIVSPGFDTPGQAFNDTSYTYFYDTETQYGRNRIDLAKHLLKLAKEQYGTK